MTIRRSLAALAGAALIVLSIPAAAADKVVESMWASGPMTIDGVAQEWDESTPIVDPGSKVEYALRNDGRNLYIIMVFRTPPPTVRAKIFPKSTLDYTGMRVFFTTGAKKSKDNGHSVPEETVYGGRTHRQPGETGADADGSPESGDPQEADPHRLHRRGHQTEEGLGHDRHGRRGRTSGFQGHREGAVGGLRVQDPPQPGRRRARPDGQAGLRVGRHDRPDPARHDGRPGRPERQRRGGRSQV